MGLDMTYHCKRLRNNLAKVCYGSLVTELQSWQCLYLASLLLFNAIEQLSKWIEKVATKCKDCKKVIVVKNAKLII